VIAVSDDSEANSDDSRSCHRRRRAVTKKKVSYHEISNSDTATSDSEPRSPRPRCAAPMSASKPNHRRLKESDSEYQPSSDAEAGNAGSLLPQTAGRCKRLGASSDESGSEAISKKKGRLNRIMSSSDYSSSDNDENPLTDDDKDIAVNGDCPPLPVVNGEHDASSVELNARSENNKGFTIASLLKTTEKIVSLDKISESSELNDLGGEDSLSGIEDLVDYVTQSWCSWPTYEKLFRAVLSVVFLCVLSV